MTRRTFLGGAAAAGVAGCVSPGEGGGRSRPDVLFIITDQQRAECLGAAGNSDIRTPHIDGLARDGVLFNECYCPYPVCTPSRYSMVSGLYAHEHRAWSNHSTLPPSVETFPAILRAAGYKTAAVGKMHYTPTYFDVGFDRMILAEQNGPGRWDDDYHRVLKAEGLFDWNDLEDQERPYRNRARPEYWETFGALESNLPMEFHSTQWIGDHAVDEINNWTDDPQLLTVSFIKPHHPFDPPREYMDAYNPDKLSLLPGWTDACFAHDIDLNAGYFPHESLNEPALRRVMALYYAGIEHIDAQVGRLVQAMQRRGRYNDALIVFTSDHGEYLGHHHLLLKGNYMYDPVSRVPLVVKHPRNANNGHTSSALVNLVDLAPTVLSAAGCTVPAAMHGADLASPPDRPYVFSESHGGEQVMVRSRSHKLLLHRHKRTSQFYDLENDPQELNNLAMAATNQDRMEAFVQQFEEWRGWDFEKQHYVDEDAPIIDADNARSYDDGHREGMRAYYDEKMKAVQTETA
jgi:arylsulfatase